MHDIRALRQNPQEFADALAQRGVTAPMSDILALDAQLRSLTGDRQNYEQRRNQAARQAGQARAQGDLDSFESLRADATECRHKAAQLDEQIKEARSQLESLMASLPNLPAPETPAGQDESDNVEIRRTGTPRTFDFEVADHVTIGAGLTRFSGLAQMDFTDTARMSGARFVTLCGDLARLERALARMMLEMHTGSHGYTEVSPPYLVKSDAVFATGQLPKFADDLFHTDTDYYAIPTAEVPLTNLARERIFQPRDLPVRLTAATPCFRSEAGAAGQDTRGMIRLHQFLKVELVSITAPQDSDTELERMTSCAEAIVQALDLPCRVVALCAGDMGFAARRTYDLEVWMPSAGRYREISSCSSCGDFQARRMAARLRPDARTGDQSLQYVHTLNGSALAVGRTLAALLENYQNADGSVDLPSVLWPFLGGVRRLEPEKNTQEDHAHSDHQ